MAAPLPLRSNSSIDASPQGSSPQGTPLSSDVLLRVQGEYTEMPGLRLTTAEAQRLWGLDREVCDALLGALVEAKFLFKTREGSFARLDEGGASVC